MSQADELLNSLDEGIAIASVNPETEPHIVIDDNRNITVPDELRRIAVQYDHNIETVTFDCPRYWDGHDLSAMAVYINYMRADGQKGFFVAENIEIDENDTNIMHFTWTISKNVTMYKGSVSFLVCAVVVDKEGNEELHWNSELCNQISVSEGLECGEAIEEAYPDIYTQLVDLVNANTFSDYYKDMIYKNASDIGAHTNEISVLNNNVSSLQTGLSATVSRVANVESDLNDNYYTKSDVNVKINEVTTNTNQKFATLEAQVNGVSGAVTELDTEVDGLRASVDYMSEHKADTSTVNGVISDVSKLDDRVTANETAINRNTSNINAVDARVDSLFDADTQFSKDIASVNATATIAKTKADTALARNEFTDAEKSKLAGITNPMVIKGTVTSVSDLPSTAEIGWFYFVGADDADVYDEYCYSQNGWEYVGTSQEGVDLSNYYTKSDVNVKINEVTTNTNQKFATLEAQVNGVSGAVTELDTEVDGLRASVDYMSEHKADTSTVNGVISDVSKLDDRVTANETAINRNTSNINAVDARVDSLFDADTQFSKDIASVNATATIAKTKAETNQTDIANNRLIDGTTLGYQKKNLFDWAKATWLNPSGSITVAKTDTDISVTSKNSWASATYKLPELEIGRKYTFSVLVTDLAKDTATGSTGVKIRISYDAGGKNPIEDFDLESDGNYEMSFTPTSSTAYVIFYPNYSSSVLTNSFTASEIMLRYADITDNTYEPYVGSVDERLNKFTSDIASLGTTIANDRSINKTTLGYQKKNLLNPNAVNWYKPTEISIADDGTITSSTTSDSRSWNLANAEYFITLPPGKYTIKTETETIDNTASNNENIRGYNESGSQIFDIYPNVSGTKTASFTITEETTVAIMFKLFTQTCKIMIYDAAIKDSTYEPYVESVDERLNKFTTQSQLYNNTTGGDSTQTITINGLFTKYSMIICNIATTGGTYSLVLPLRYIKSLGTENYYSANSLLFYYVDDNNMTIKTGLGQTNPTIGSVQLVGLY